MKRFISFVVALLMFGLADASFAQGTRTGTIRGEITDPQGLAAPGVVITVTSTALQGGRKTSSDGQGRYVFNGLPAGNYDVKFELAGFATIEHMTTVPVGGIIEQNVKLQTAVQAETIDVVAETPAPIATPTTGANFRNEEIFALATPRTIQGIAQLAPAVNENSPNVGQVVVNGAFAFDNVFMINGVDINDNLFATPQNLFIEDAIEETQVLTSGISAEFGRFTGGVINAITKSGSNNFSGSGRVNFLNPSWTTVTPFEECKDKTIVNCSAATEHVDKLSRTYEGTFGGPIIRDRLWFFTAGRYGETTNQVNLQETGIALSSVDNNKRGEIKGTATPIAGHTLQVGFLNDPRTRTNNSGLQSFIIDPHSEVDRSNPNHYVYANYRAVLKNNSLVEAQYSQRHFKFEGDGGTSKNILDSPFIALSCACLYNAPYFDATDPEDRNNRQITGSMTQYWNLRGRHETKGGYEWYRSQRTGGNSQSSTSYVFNSDFATNPDGTPAFDANGRIIPVFDPNSGSSVDFFPAVRGGTMNIDNNSLYAQDHWTINGRWSADLGARYEHVKVLSNPGNIQSVSSNRIVPRLAVAYDLSGNGNKVVHATYGQYSGRYNEAQIGANSPVGNPADINFTYTGPAGQGRDFAPGFNLANYPVSTAFVFSAPTANVIMDPSLKSPLTHEFTLSYGSSILSGRGYFDATYVARIMRDFVEDIQDTTTGITHVFVSNTDPAAGTPSTDPNSPAFTNRVFKNINSYKGTDLQRDYQSLEFQARYRLTPSWSIAGHYTVELKNEGNYLGEGSNTPGTSFLSNSPSVIGNYPEAFNVARNYPVGNLPNFERSRVRIWSIYNFNVGGGDLQVSGLWRYDSPTTFSLAARNQALTGTQVGLMTAAGYPEAGNLAALGPLSGNHVFFNTLGSESFSGYGLLDFSLNYGVPVYRELRPYIKFDVYNLFDNRKLIAWNTTVSQNKANVDNLGLGTTFNPGASFGRASGNTVTNLGQSGINTFPLSFSGAPAGGRTIRMSIGLRF